MTRKGPPIYWNLEKFLDKCKEVHGDKYDYSNVVFETSGDKIEIGCKIHGNFIQMMLKHLKGQGCPKCAMYIRKKRNTLEHFITRSNEKHNNQYDYSKVELKTVQDKVAIICKKHGEFLQTPGSHMRGRGCPSCYEKLRGNSQKFNRGIFIERAKIIHGDKYDYSKVEYKNSQTKIIIICKKHGEFSQIPNSHLTGYGCQRCSGEKRAEDSRYTTEEFISQCKEVHGSRYDYSKTIYGLRQDDKVTIICKKHGEFKQAASSHLCGRGCPKCIGSVGENKIRLFLEKMNIPFEEQKSFKTCVYRSRLRFDFWIPMYNLLIEFDGIQHYPEEITKSYKYRFIRISKDIELVKARDEFKTKWCEENMINLLRIKYSDNINDKLTEYLEFLKEGL